jgi:hypothetical protein
VLHKSADEKITDGVCERTSGSFHWNYAWDETVCILKGRFSITPERREPMHLQAGDAVHFPKGLRAKWEIAETVRKVLFLGSDQVLALEKADRDHAGWLGDIALGGGRIERQRRTAEAAEAEV